jgi:hypothetical protein
MEEKSLRVSEHHIIMSVSKFDPDGKHRNTAEVNFQLHFLCDVPILTFHFKKPNDVVVLPIHFEAFESWPECPQLTILLQFQHASGTSISVRQIVLSEDDTEAILQARLEQMKMKSRQVDSIIELISPEFLGFCEQPFPESKSKTGLLKY